MIQIKLNDRVRDNFLQIRQQLVSHQLEAKRLESLLQTGVMSIALNNENYIEGMDVSLSAECDQIIVQEIEKPNTDVKI